MNEKDNIGVKDRNIQSINLIFNFYLSLYYHFFLLIVNLSPYLKFLRSWIRCSRKFTTNEVSISPSLLGSHLQYTAIQSKGSIFSNLQYIPYAHVAIFISFSFQSLPGTIPALANSLQTFITPSLISSAFLETSYELIINEHKYFWYLCFVISVVSLGSRTFMIGLVK